MRPRPRNVIRKPLCLIALLTGCGTLCCGTLSKCVPTTLENAPKAHPVFFFFFNQIQKGCWREHGVVTISKNPLLRGV